MNFLTKPLLILALLLPSIALGQAEATPDVILPKITVSGVADVIPFGEMAIIKVPKFDGTPNLINATFQFSVFDSNLKPKARVDYDTERKVQFGVGIKPDDADYRKFLVVLDSAFLFKIDELDKDKKPTGKFQLVQKFGARQSYIVLAGNPPAPDNPDNPPTPPKPDTIPDFPQSKFDLPKPVWIAFSGIKLDAAKKSALAKAYTENFNAVSAAWKETGTDPAKFLTVEQGLDKIHSLNVQSRANLGVSDTITKDFSKTLNDLLYKLVTDGKLTDKAEHATSFDEVSLALSKFIK